MKRREFMAAAGAVGILPLANMARAEHTTDDHERDYLELRTYHIETEAQLANFGKFGEKLGHRRRVRGSDKEVEIVKRLFATPV